MANDPKSAFLQLLGLARRAGRAELGEDGVGAALAAGKGRVVFLAADAAENSARRAAHFSEGHHAVIMRAPCSKEELGSDFVFVTHYPARKRPFYAMDDPDDPRYTLSFDLLFRGLEVTTGGQRIHDWHQQVAKMEERGMDPADFESYLMIHKCGMPPHGGLGIGLERLTMQLCGLDNVRKACLFPRDRTRLEP